MEVSGNFHLFSIFVGNYRRSNALGRRARGAFGVMEGGGRVGGGVFLVGTPRRGGRPGQKKPAAEPNSSAADPSMNWNRQGCRE